MSILDRNPRWVGTKLIIFVRAWEIETRASVITCLAVGREAAENYRVPIVSSFADWLFLSGSSKPHTANSRSIVAQCHHESIYDHKWLRR